LLYLDPRQLVPDDENVRREANDGDLEGLAASLRQYGVLQPLGVAPLDAPAAPQDGAGAGRGRYRVVYGNRRRAAAIMAGLPAVPCLSLSPERHPDHLVTQLLENMQRRDLNDAEKAEGLARLRRHLAAADGAAGAGAADGLDDRVAGLVGLAPRTVRRYLALRHLPPAVRDFLADERLTVTQAQHLHQLATPALQTEVAARAVDEDWTAARISRVCTALVRAPGSSLDEAVRAAGGGWEDVERLGPAPAPGGVAAPAPAAAPRVAPRPKAEEPEGDDAGLWQEDATGAPTPEALGEPDAFAPPPGAGAGRAGEGQLEPETRDGHRVFRIRTLSAFCDEVDRLARCLQDGDLAKATREDPGAATRLRLAAKQLTFTLRGVESLLG
jgi:ParB family chromosome partitioning protein